MLYAIIPLEENRFAKEDDWLSQRVKALDPTAYVHYAPHFYLVSYPGTSMELAKEVGFSNKAETTIAGVILNVTYYYGHASPDIWEWLEARNRG